MMYALLSTFQAVKSTRNAAETWYNQDHNIDHEEEKKITDKLAQFFISIEHDRAISNQFNVCESHILSSPSL